MKKSKGLKSHTLDSQRSSLPLNLSANRLMYAIILLLPLILYANTILNDYALDDGVVITKNEYTKMGFAGIRDILTHDTFTGFFQKQTHLVAGGRYRPLSLVTFAIEYQLFGQNPHVSHLINVVLYATTGALLLFLLLKIVPISPHVKWYFSIPFVATILFLAHPIHTEVVANIKGRDDIMSFFGCLLALIFIVKFVEKGKVMYLISSGIAFFLGLLSKENAISFAAIIPMTLHYFIKPSTKKYVRTLVPTGIAVILFLVIRGTIIGSTATPLSQELLNNPFVNASTSEKYATIVQTFRLYIKLLMFPHPLTFDYYPKQVPIVNWTDLRATSSLVICSGLLLFAIIGWKKKTLTSYGLWFSFATFAIASNIFFPIGTLMGERFVYMPSLGFCLILSTFLTRRLPQYIKNEKILSRVITTLLLVILSLYSFKTIMRNTAWENDFTLFTTDVQTSANSAKSNTSAGGALIEEAKKSENESRRKELIDRSISYLNKALEIHPSYLNAILLLGNAYYEYDKDYDKAIAYYKKILHFDPDYNDAYLNISYVLQNVKDADYKIRVYEELYMLNPNRYDATYQLGVLYGRYKNDIPKAITYFERAVTLDSKQAVAFRNLGVAYGLSGNFKKAEEALQTSIGLDPNDPQAYMNLGVTYRQMGDTVKARQWLDRATRISNQTKKTN